MGDSLHIFHLAYQPTFKMRVSHFVNDLVRKDSKVLNWLAACSDFWRLVLCCIRWGIMPSMQCMGQTFNDCLLMPCDDLWWLHKFIEGKSLAQKLLEWVTAEEYEIVIISCEQIITDSVKLIYHRSDSVGKNTSIYLPISSYCCAWHVFPPKLQDQ